MQTYKLETQYSDYNVIIETGKYRNGRLALELIDAEDGCPVMTATVNLPEVGLEEDEIIIKNYSENEGVLEFLIKNKITSNPVRWVNNGFVDFPIVKIIKK